MSKQIWKGSALLAPLPPALVTCGTMEDADILTVGWTGIINSHPPKTYVSVRPERYSYNLIKRTGEFAINLPTRKLVRCVDYCGVRSKRDTDKLRDCNLHIEKGVEIDAPILVESPVNLECRVFDVISLGTHDMFLADILSVRVEEDLVDNEGKLRLNRCSPIAYSHGEYYALGDRLGKFGYSVKKKKSTRRTQGKKG
ncbi:MAG: flavin reductase family protein [Clostridia bacterium]|nr:flavin reductase family protein [Clostridia bacterium]